MVKPETYNGETVVWDEDGYAIEMPLTEGGHLLCPASNCQKMFDREETRSITGHLAHEGYNLTVERTCKNCGDTFSGPKSFIREKQYCGRECAANNRILYGDAKDVANDIRDFCGCEQKDVWKLRRRCQSKARYAIDGTEPTDYRLSDENLPDIAADLQRLVGIEDGGKYYLKEKGLRRLRKVLYYGDAEPLAGNKETVIGKVK